LPALLAELGAAAERYIDELDASAAAKGLPRRRGPLLNALAAGLRHVQEREPLCNFALQALRAMAVAHCYVDPSDSIDPPPPAGLPWDGLTPSFVAMPAERSQRWCELELPKQVLQAARLHAASAPLHDSAIAICCALGGPRPELAMSSYLIERGALDVAISAIGSFAAGKMELLLSATSLVAALAARESGRRAAQQSGACAALESLRQAWPDLSDLNAHVAELQHAIASGDSGAEIDDGAASGGSSQLAHAATPDVPPARASASLAAVQKKVITNSHGVSATYWY